MVLQRPQSCTVSGWERSAEVLLGSVAAGTTCVPTDRVRSEPAETAAVAAASTATVAESELALVAGRARDFARESDIGSEPRRTSSRPSSLRDTRDIIIMSRL